MSFSPIRTLLGAVTLIAASFSSQATLITNGDFESNQIDPNSWTFLSSSDVAGWQGSNIEIWNALNGVMAVSGDHFIELNAHGANVGDWSIFQTFATEINRQYELSFFYRARNNNDERFEVSVPGLEWDISGHAKDVWTKFENTFTATSTSSILRFRSLTAGTEGNFIDNVQVTASPGRDVSVAVPEPTTLAAFGAGLLALFGLRRNKTKA
ncbi:hypothetical protein VT06_08440 [Arsukibacterium sp. MJ3]|uniref:DUF642 domain-containing protein n=1 Tax=Arsukibacterium sp. MJ3 TaxID=1632859 RepID=UPI00062736C1|nr:DUF642 domain-containing protein [Arsukibacterium sp. MJ3]KKO49008.1 hypothetical protein VT06_08440 [Arsukibacterium sp. MJ3]